MLRTPSFALAFRYVSNTLNMLYRDNVRCHQDDVRHCAQRGPHGRLTVALVSSHCGIAHQSGDRVRYPAAFRRRPPVIGLLNSFLISRLKRAAVTTWRL